MVSRFWGMDICGFRPGYRNNFTKLFWIFQHWARLKHIFIKRLPVVIGHEQRRAHSFQKALFVNIAVCIMNKSARFNVAIGVDMKVSPSACNATCHIFSVILKIYCKSVRHVLYSFRRFTICPAERQRKRGHSIDSSGESGNLWYPFRIIIYSF